MTKYEYKIIDDSNRKIDEITKDFNELGAQGWKLSRIIETKYFSRYIFERELQEKPKRTIPQFLNS